MNDAPIPHADHDPLLVAAHAAGDLPVADRARATAMLERCAECAALRADLVVLSSAVREAPTPPRPRSYTLSADDAERIRRTGWRRLLGAFAAPRFDVMRPVGATLATLGIAGLLLTAIPSVSLMGAAGAAPGGGPSTPAANPYSAAGDPAASAGDSGEAPAGDLGVGQGAEGGPEGASPMPVEAAPDGEQQPTRQVAEDRSQPDPAAEARRIGEDVTLPVVSGTFLIVGLGLVGLRWTARRLGDG